ncbi:FecR family protein [Winogradskyella pacifica]|uniref:FecR family protein n=1 Tax=Winogradskyella pacifica TaxID=664642 RepID=A0A3D9N415_9FLAO|nr:FecR family protein [Winogradskyella pacifica]REE27657.1 FecR family protein [Winogradskyella pacifica]
MNPDFWVLVTKYLSNEASEEDINSLFLLLETDKKYQIALDETIAKWNAVNAIDTKIFNTDASKEALFVKINTKKKTNFFPSKSTYIAFSKIAATLVLVLVSCFFLNNLLDTDWKEFKTAKNEKLKIVLPDSTLIWLNKNSSISYNFSSKDKRLLKLEGEAFFDVKRNEQKPFIVESQYFTTQVLGTSFNINSNVNEKASVSVISGEVAVSILNTSELVLLERGQKAVYDDTSNRILKKILLDVENEMAWVDKTFVFNDTRLESVLNYLSKNYAVNFEVNNPNLKNCLITANFRNESLKNILTIICASLDCEFKKVEHNTIILSGNGCEKKPEILVVSPAKNQ